MGRVWGGENFPVSVFYPLCEHLVEGKEQVPVAVRRKLRRVSLLPPQADPSVPMPGSRTHQMSLIYERRGILLLCRLWGPTTLVEV